MPRAATKKRSAEAPKKTTVSDGNGLLPPLLTQRDLEERWGISAPTAFRLRAKGDWPKGIRIGITTRWRPEDVAKFEQRYARRST